MQYDSDIDMVEALTQKHGGTLPLAGLYPGERLLAADHPELVKALESYSKDMPFTRDRKYILSPYEIYDRLTRSPVYPLRRADYDKLEHHASFFAILIEGKNFLGLCEGNGDKTVFLFKKILEKGLKGAVQWIFQDWHKANLVVTRRKMVNLARAAEPNPYADPGEEIIDPHQFPEAIDLKDLEQYPESTQKYLREMVEDFYRAPTPVIDPPIKNLITTVASDVHDRAGWSDPKARTLAEAFPEISANGNILQVLREGKANTIVFMLGSTLNNFSVDQIEGLFKLFYEEFKEGDIFVISVDATVSNEKLKEFYDNHWFKQWIINGLTRQCKEEISSDFNPNNVECKIVVENVVEKQMDFTVVRAEICDKKSGKVVAYENIRKMPIETTCQIAADNNMILNIRMQDVVAGRSNSEILIFKRPPDNAMPKSNPHSYITCVA